MNTNNPYLDLSNNTPPKQTLEEIARQVGYLHNTLGKGLKDFIQEIIHNISP